MITNVLVGVLAVIAFGATIWANWGNNKSEDHKSEDQTDKTGKKNEDR